MRRYVNCPRLLKGILGFIHLRYLRGADLRELAPEDRRGVITHTSLDGASRGRQLDASIYPGLSRLRQEFRSVGLLFGHFGVWVFGISAPCRARRHAAARFRSWKT